VIFSDGSPPPAGAHVFDWHLYDGGMR